MTKQLNYIKTTAINGKIQISGSKSESNRLLIIQQLFPFIQIENLSDSDDTKVLQKALESQSNTIDIGHAGTSMRFLTAFFATQKGKTTILTGSKRMQERPIKILVKALTDLGAKIQYVDKEGFPPLHIEGTNLNKNRVSMAGNISSQYISALLLIAPSLKNGLEIKLQGQITSRPYIEMTLKLLASIGIVTSFHKNTIQILPFIPNEQDGTQISNLKSQIFKIEPDWSSASYYYSLAALQPNSKIKLLGFKKNSLQGDSILPDIYNKLGVKTTFNDNGITLYNNSSSTDAQFGRLNQIRRLNQSGRLNLNLSDTPDLAQTIAVTCLGLGLDCYLTGLHTLKIKETDRLQALKNELEKFGARVQITKDSLKMESIAKIDKDILVKTYDDHRMAMAFAPLSVLVPIQVENPGIVSKSYPNFWEDWGNLMNLY